MNRFFSRVFASALAAGCLLAGGRLAAQNDSNDSFCILPIYDALTGGVPDATLQTEMNKLKAQVGPQRNYFKVGFSNIFGGPSSGASAARMAAANGLSCGFIIALQTHDASSTTLAVANQDFRCYQWRLDGKTWLGDNTGTSSNPAYPARDYQCVTPSRYATALQSSFKSQIQTTAGQIKTVMNNYPGTVVVVNAIIEEELATGDGTDTYLADYSPFAVTEFRDWLRHTGMYDDSTGTFAGQGAPAAITGTFVNNSQGKYSSPFYDDPSPNTLGNGRTGKTFNATFGTTFTTWTCEYWDLTAYPSAITNTSFTPAPAAGATGYTAGGFDAPRTRNPSNAFWKAWSWDVLDQNGAYPTGNPSAPAFGFRQVMVKHFVNDLLGWVVAAGIPSKIVYAHQIPGETAVTSTRLRTGADPVWTGITDFNGHGGFTRFGSFAYNTAQMYSQNWGIFEWHPDPGAVATDPVLYSNTISSLNSYYVNGAHVLFPGWWENTNGTQFLLTDSNFAVGLHDWLAAQPDLPPPGGQGLSARYFNNTALTGTPALTRVDPTVNFNWNGTSPDPSINSTNFSAIWSGWIQAPTTDAYTFYTDTDDGVRLYVNNAAVINHFTTQSLTEYSGTISLTAGQWYPITVQYFQGTGNAIAQLSWSNSTISREIVPPNVLSPALPTTNWTNTAAGASSWSTASNWTGNAAPTSGSDAEVQFLGGQTAVAGTLTADSGAAAFSLNALELSGTSPSSGTAAVSLTDGTLQFTDAASGQKPAILLDAIKSGSGAINYTVGNAMTLGDLTTVYGNGNGGFTFSGPISITGGLVKQGTSGLTLSGSNSFVSGALARVEGGTLGLGNLNALSGSGGIYVDTGAQLNATASGTYASVPTVLNDYGSGSSNAGGALRFNVNSAKITWPGALTFADSTQVTFFSAGGSYAFTSPMTGAGDIQFHAGGAAANHFHTLLLAAASNYTGNTTAYGDAANITLQLSGVSNALPTTTTLTLAGDYDYSTALRGWLDLNGNNQTLAGLVIANGARGAGDNRVVNSATTNSTLTINNTSADTFAGVLGGGSGATNNNLNLSKTGAGTLTLTGTNTYTGYTSVTGGTLVLSAASNNIAASAVIDVETGAALNVSTVTGGFTAGAAQTLSGVGTIMGAATIAGNHQPGVGGTQTFASGVTFAASAREVWQLLDNTVATASYGQTAVTGKATFTSGAAINVNLAASGSVVNLTNVFWTQAHTWTLLTATSLSGMFGIGTVSNDPAGNVASNYGALTVAQTSTAVSLVWTPFKPLAVWQNVHFGANAGNPAIAGPNANPSGDGIANLIKYALGLDPTVPTVAGLPVVTRNGGHLQMQFTRNTGATDINLQVLASNDLVTWTAVATLPAGATAWTTSGAMVTDNNGQVTVLDSTVSTGRRFLRLQASQ